MDSEGRAGPARPSESRLLAHLFYKQFAGKEDCLLAAHRQLLGRVLEGLIGPWQAR